MLTYHLPQAGICLFLVSQVLKPYRSKAFSIEASMSLAKVINFQQRPTGQQSAMDI